jgi:glycosyltransferase involved in cell wall biosynthesis
LRIGFDARWYNDSGVGNYVAGLLRAMAGSPRGFDLFVYEHPDNRVPDLDDLPLHRIMVQSSRYSLRGQLDMARRTRIDKLDAFQSPFYIIPLAASCPVIVTLHDVIPFLFPIYSVSKRWMVKTGYRTAAHRATQVIAVSHTTARDIGKVLRVPARRVSVVHNAVPRAWFHPNENDEEVGAIRKQYGVSRPYVMVANPRNWHTKNLGTALDALQLAQQETGKKFQTVIYGPGAGVDASSNRYRALDVVKTGFLPAEDLGKMFRHAAAFIFPSLYEGFGLPLLEAISCGCPVVTSNGGALAEVAGEGAQVFNPSDAHGMATAVARLLCDEQERDRWRTRALARASEFSWEKTAEETAAVYRQVCSLSVRGRELELNYRNDPESTRY